MANAANIFNVSGIFFTGTNGDFTSQGGALRINSGVQITFNSGVVTSGFRLTTGTIQAGYVLQAQDSFGNAAWVPTISGVNSFRSITGSTTLTALDSMVYVNSSGSGNLPVITCMSASQIPGRVFTIKKTDISANLVLISGSGAQTIDGYLAFPLVLPNQFIRFQSDGSNYLTI